MRNELSEKLGTEVKKLTPEKQQEVDGIRNEILNAVKNHQYKYGSASEIVGSPLWHQIPTHKTRKDESMPVTKNPNTTAYSLKFLDKFNLNADSYRDVLDLIEVRENYTFTIDRIVVDWKTIPNSMRGSQVIVGLTENGLILLTEKGGVFSIRAEITFEGKQLKYFDTIFQWNNYLGVAEGFAVVAVGENLVWVQMGDKFDQLTEVWQWELNKDLTFVKYYKHNDESMLFVSSEVSFPSNRTSVDVYSFDLDKREFWLIQPIQIPNTCYSVAVLDWRKILLIAIPVVNETQIYKYANKRFQLQEIIPSQNVTTVAGFQIGGLCYFAIGGSEPKIIRFQNHRLTEVNVSGKTYNFVQRWLPIPVHTFRDDILLLVQYEVPFDTHSLMVVATLRWDGNQFETVFDVPCYMDDKLHHSGINCMIDFDKSRGLGGAAVLTSGQKTSVLVPRQQAKSGLYDLKLEIRAAAHPREDQLVEIQMMFDYFLDLKDYSDRVLRIAQSTLEKVEAPKNINVISRLNTVKELITKSIEIDHVVFPISVNGKIVNSNEPKIRTEDVVKELQLHVSDILHTELDLDKTDESNVIVPGNGQFRIHSLRVLNRRGNYHSRKSRQTQPNHLDRLVVSNIDFDFVNGVSKKDLIFSDESNVDFESQLEIEGSAIISEHMKGAVNNIDLDSDVLCFDKNDGIDHLKIGDLEMINLELKNSINSVSVTELIKQLKNYQQYNHPLLRTESLDVKGYLEFEKVNGIIWVDLLENLVIRDRRDHIDEIHVKGVSDNFSKMNINS